MRLDGSLDLCFLDDIFVHTADRLAEHNRFGVGKLHAFKSGRAVDSGDRIAVIHFTLAGKKEQVVVRFYRNRLSCNRSALCLNVHLDFGAEAVVVGDGKQADIRLVEIICHRVGRNANLLDQPHLISVNRRQTVKQIDPLPMRGGITQHARRMQRSNRLFRLIGVIHALRLVDDNDRSGILYVPHRRFAVQFVLRLVDDVLRFAESVDIDDHDLNITACRKLSNIG